MRSPLARLAVAILAAFALLSLWKWHSAGTGRVTDAGQSARRQQIQSFWKLYNAATEARLRRDFASAADGYRHSLRLDPRHEDSHYYLGTSLLEMGDYDGAAEVFAELARLNPQSNRAFMQLGMALSTLAPGAQPDFAAAGRAFTRSAEINKEESGPFLRLGLLELNRGRLDEALKFFTVAAGAGAPEGFFLAGYTRFLQSKDHEAAPLFQKVLEINAREKQISGRGVLSEGDLKPSSGEQKELTPLERAGLKALLFLYWTAARSGGYGPGVPNEFRLHPPAEAVPAERGLQVQRLPGAEGRALWMGSDLLVVAPDRPVKLYRQNQGRWAEAAAGAGLAGWNDFWDAASFDYDADRRADLYLVRAGWMGKGQNILLRNSGGLFQDVTAEAGLSGRRATAKALPLDYDGDGRTDLLEAGNSGPDFPALRLYHNEGGRFVERGRELGLAYEGNAVDVAVADYDGDSWPDIFVLGWRREAKLYRNLLGLSFRDVTAEAGLAGVGGNGYSALFFDYDRDGRPDLLVTACASWERSLERLLAPGRKSAGDTPRLFHNEGNGRFREVTAEVGLDRSYGILQAVAADVDGDGWPDLVFALGSLERTRAEPSVVLRNEEGKRFSPWLYLPGFDAPVNALGAAAAGNKLFLSGVGVMTLPNP